MQAKPRRTVVDILYYGYTQYLFCQVVLYSVKGIDKNLNQNMSWLVENMSQKFIRNMFRHDTFARLEHEMNF